MPSFVSAVLAMITGLIWLVSPCRTACKPDVMVSRSLVMMPILARTGWRCALAAATVSSDRSVCAWPMKCWTAARSAGVPSLWMTALMSAENVSIIAVESFSAAMHPGSPVRRWDTLTAKLVNVAAPASETTMPTIDRALPEPARALDLTSPIIEKSRPSGQNKIPSTMPATA